MSNNKEASIRYDAPDRCFRNTSRRFFIEDLRKACSAALYRETGTDKYSDPDNPCISKKHIYDDIQFLICPPKYYASIVNSEADAAFNRIVDTVMRRMRCSDTPSTASTTRTRTSKATSATSSAKSSTTKTTAKSWIHLMATTNYFSNISYGRSK